MLYAFVVSRHGQRTPIMCCKMLPKNVPEDHGQLTREGHEQTFKLGLFLRVRYKRFLVADEPDQLLATHVRLQRYHRMFGLALTGNELWYAENVLGEVVETLSQKFEKGIERPDRLHVFSMSDSSVYSILKLLDTSYDDHPCFCASVIFEVFEDASKVKRVQVLLSTKTDEDPQLVATDKLKNPCELKEFLDFVRGILKS
ncbi:hypothetical protein HPB52_009009 [Rhipicephalus sanguineus]|uniref:Lysosomal acid phosphatase n=1 Tax=Rhipicephalus sanguineus TaxID=34632 RepID=A0A9D4PLK1_RHISA|nr:hypothetical protein HPB52_009009 [Rhipicephalus sanguineus]